MANIKSQIKRNKTNEKARLRNKAVKSALEDGDPHASARPPAAGDAEAAAALRAASRSSTRP